MGYSESFKLKVLAEHAQGGVSLEALGRKYGIGGHTTIAKWVKRYRIVGAQAVDGPAVLDALAGPPALALSQEEEIARLHAALAQKEAELVALTAFMLEGRKQGLDLSKKKRALGS